ncbi:MAG: ATP-binding protein [Anaerolineales bacterium]
MTATRLGSLPLSLRTLFGTPRASVSRFQHVLEQIPGAAFMMNPRTGQFIAVNSRATGLTGRTRDELLNRALAEVIAEPETLAQFHNIEVGNQRQLFDVAIRTLGGQIIKADVRLSAFEEGNDVIAVAVVTPAEERLAADVERSRNAHVLEHLHLLLDLFESPTNESLQVAAQRIAEIFQADAVALYRCSADGKELWLDFAQGPDDAFPLTLDATESTLFKASFAWTVAHRTEMPIAARFRAVGWTHVLGQPIGHSPAMGALVIAYAQGNAPAANASAYLEVVARQIMALIRQIMRHAHLVAANRLAFHLTNQLSAINAQIDEAVITLNAAGELDDLNTAAAQLLGYRAEEVIGKSFEAMLALDDALLPVLQSVLGSAEAPQFEKEGKMHRRNGEVFPVIARMRPLPETSGGCVIVLRDVSHEHAERIRREHLDHLAYVGESSHAFAHEVRAPLNNISVGVQFLAARIPSDDPMHLHFTKIQAESARLSELMNSMLGWAKPIDPQLTPTDLPALLNRLMQRWNAKMQQRNITRAFAAEAECPPVLADAILLERVFVNLIENALQAMAAGGHLTVTLRTTDRGAHGCVVEVRIADTGPGIPEEIRKRIFEPYFTTRADGTGLGLPICKRIVTVHHGAINCESFPGTGTIFTVTLPVHLPATLHDDGAPPGD